MKKFLLSTLALLGMTGMAFAGTGTLEDPYTPTEALAKINGGYEGPAVVKGYVIGITEVSTQYGNATYTLGDEATSTTTLSVYRGYYLNGDKFTSQNQLQKGDLLVVSGDLVNYKGNTPQFTTGSKIISINGSTEGSGGNDNPVDPTPGEKPEGDNVTFSFSDPTAFGFDPADAKDSALDLTGKTLTSGIATIKCEGEGAQTPIRFYLSTAGRWSFRFYKGTEFTVSVPEGYNLTGIEFSGNNIGTDWTYSNGQLSGTTWTPSGEVRKVTIGKSATGNNPTIDSMTVYYKVDSGVEEIIAADDAEAVYFDLQGRKVANPERGIFIKKVGNKAAKVVL